MTTAIAWMNGQLIPANQAVLPVTDLGVSQGVAVTEMMRTFGHQAFRIDEHLNRFRRSLEVVGWTNLIPKLEDIKTELLKVVSNNAPLIDDDDDLGVNLFATGGHNRSYEMAETASPLQQKLGEQTVVMHTFPLQFQLWSKSYEDGVHLGVSQTRAMPADVIDPTIKYRSRLHWYLADRDVSHRIPGAKAILLDHDGYLTETSSGNFFAVIDDTIITPPASKVLPGISQLELREIAAGLGQQVEERDLTPDDLSAASEAFVSSTPYCLLPVTRFDNKAVGNGRPGPRINALLQAWSEKVGVKIEHQASRFSLRGT